MSKVDKKYSNHRAKIKLTLISLRSQSKPANDDHEAYKTVSYSTKHGRIEFKVSEQGESLSFKYEDFMSPNSVSLELGLEYIKRERSIIKLCELIKPAQIYIKQGQEICKGGYKKFGWWLVIDDEKTSFEYRVGGLVKWKKVI